MNAQLKQAINDARGATQNLADVVKHIERHPALATLAKPGEDMGEAIANLRLAYRHLEDARMRLGKSIQAMEGGVSIFDKAASASTVEHGPKEA